MFFETGIIKHPKMLNIFKSHIQKTGIPSYIAIPEDSNINQVKVFGVIGSVEESVDEDGEIITECSVCDEQNTYLGSILRDFLSNFSDQADAFNVLIDIAIYHMDYLASEFLVAYNFGDYHRALFYANAFKHQFYSVVNSVGIVFADYDLASYIVDTIPFVEYKCNQEYSTPTE